MKKLFLLTIVCLSLSACGTHPERTIKTLEDAGYTDVSAGGFGWFECSKGDKFQTKFIATNPVGKIVTGTVCCGWMKGCTIRH